MKKIIYYIAIVMLSFFAACDNAEKTEVKTENGTIVKEPVINTVDTTKRTSISVGPGGADVKHKTTEVNVNKSGVKVGTKDVKVEVKK